MESVRQIIAKYEAREINLAKSGFPKVLNPGVESHKVISSGCLGGLGFNNWKNSDFRVRLPGGTRRSPFGQS